MEDSLPWVAAPRSEYRHRRRDDREGHSDPEERLQPHLPLDEGGDRIHEGDGHADPDQRAEADQDPNACPVPPRA
jgi:hypothetical protein